MLESAIHLYKKKYGDVNIYFDSSDNPSGHIKRKYNTKQVRLYRNRPINKSVRGFIKTKILESYSNNFVIDIDKIDVVLDVNGYFLADKWPIKRTRHLIDIYSRFRDSGTKIVLLPKSFGPFSIAEKAGAASHLISTVDTVFARDELSFKYLDELNSSIDNIKLGSDYTSCLDGVVDNYVENYRDKVAIIINTRMTDTGADSTQKYNNFIKNCISVLQEMKLEYYFLIHDVKNDTKHLYKYFKEYLNGNNTISTSDPIILKGYASVSSLVISSRYHGLLNALNSYVPVLGTSWSHKYKYIAKEYRVEDSIIEIDINKNCLTSKIESVLKKKQHHILYKDKIIQERHYICEDIQDSL